MADSLPLFLALELLDDSEVETSDVLGEDDDIVQCSYNSSNMCRNLNRVRGFLTSSSVTLE